MTTRDDVDRLSRALRRAVELARRDLEAAFTSLPLSNPEAARDALLEIVPALTRKYGDIAATAAAEWYEEMRAREIGGQFTATLADNADEALVQSTVRRQAGHLWKPDQSKTLEVLAGSLQRYITNSGRATVARNAEQDPARPRYARVPRGAKTCAFCMAMASRGFFYHSQEAAGGHWNHFHDDCDCQIVMVWDKDAHHIAGYNPDAMYDKYLQARESSGSGDLRVILAELRRMFPDAVTDGVI